MKKLSNVSNLLSESNEAYYWLGFLLADGHFSKNGQIQVNLSAKDLEHLRKFSTFVEYEKDLNKPSLSISDSKVVPKIKGLYDIKSNKTYYPPKISDLDGDALFSLIVGFIDGDGTICKRGYMAIKLHKTWLETIDFMLNSIVEDSRYTVTVTNEGLALGTLTNIEATKKIRLNAERLGLPILKRKWERIDLNKLSKRERREKYENECVRYFEEGLTPRQVLDKTTISHSFIKKTHKLWKETF